MTDKILIIDFGSQYTRLIARRIRELNIYSEIVPYNKLPGDYTNIKGIVLSGSPFSVSDATYSDFNFKTLPNNIPVLGICYGAQFIAKYFGGIVSSGKKREYGRAELHFNTFDNPLFTGISDDSAVWMSHGDTIINIPTGFEILASTQSVDIAVFSGKPQDHFAPIYGIQFHPEVTHTEEGFKLLYNFTIIICKCKQNWTPDSFIQSTIEEIKNTVGDDKVIIGLSGGVDSTVAAILLHRAIGNNLSGIFINNGLLRNNEFESVLAAYKNSGLNVTGIIESERFLHNLKGITNPEEKRKIIGRTFIESFEEAAHRINDVKWLAQGTIYPDVIESLSVHGNAVTIKSHHNVGGLPEKLNLKIIEPLRYLFKDEVRNIGKALHIDTAILNRHPFPGPGLAIRIIGEVTEQKIKTLQEADAIFVSALKENGFYDKVWQAGVILLPVQTVGVMGDERTYEHVAALRAVTSIDGMTADWFDFPHSFLSKVATDIINNVKGINRIVYDISTKPPATIEWE